MGSISKTIRYIICLPIKFYQYCISPFIRPCCRFYPSCSAYTIIAVTNYGLFKGGWKALKRILRCHPWSEGGYDPVFPNDESF